MLLDQKTLLPSSSGPMYTNNSLPTKNPVFFLFPIPSTDNVLYTYI